MCHILGDDYVGPEDISRIQMINEKNIAMILSNLLQEINLKLSPCYDLRFMCKAIDEEGSEFSHSEWQSWNHCYYQCGLSSFELQ